MFLNKNDAVLNPERYLNVKKLTKSEIEAALKKSMLQIDANMEYFGDSFQSAQTFDNVYKKMDNIEWTDGFWSGLLWLAYEFTNDSKYKDLGLKHVESYLHRIENKIEVNHHDMGFLYSLSCVSAYKLTGNEDAKKAALLAADNLMTRYVPGAKFLQAWGNMNADDNYRLIIDTLLNIPLLHWAYEVTGIEKYKTVAINHFNSAIRTVIREDGTTYHTYYFDAKTNQPAFGKTRQGYSDDSCWARGQSWGVYGIPLTLKYVRDLKLLDSETIQIFEKVCYQFLNNLGTDDNIAYWDLIFNDDKTQSRDSSASAIAVCGLLEILKYPKYLDEKTRDLFEHAAHAQLRSLIDKYANLDIKPGHPILYHGVYSWHSGKGVDEGNIWGDYYYVEALMRLWKDLDIYW